MKDVPPANLLNLACDVIFVDTSSTDFEADVAEAESEPATETKAGAPEKAVVPEELASRQFPEHSKDHRSGQPQLVIAMAVTAEGIRIRCWTFPGTTSDQLVIRRVKDDLVGGMRHRVLWVTDSGFNSEMNRA